MLTAQKIYDNLLSKNKIAELTGSAKEYCIRDIDLLLQFLQLQPLQFVDMCRWQYAFLSAINRKEELQHLLEEFIFYTEELEPGQPEQIQQALNMIKEGKINLTGNADDLIHFHSRLFSAMDKTAEIKYAEKTKVDLEWILKFFGRATTEKSNIHLDFVYWQQNLLESLGFQQISFVRFLMTVKLFHPDSCGVCADEAVQHLLQSFKNKQPQSSSPTIDVLTEELANYHINLFQYIDDVSAPKYRHHTMHDGKKNFEFLQEAAGLKSHELFVHYIEWLYSVLSSLGIPKLSLIRFLVSMRHIIKLKGGENWLPSIEYLDSAIKNLAQKADSYLQKSESELTELAANYLQLLLAGNRKDARQLVFDAINDGIPVRDIYLQVFEASQFEVGRLWERNQITVAQEHFCTASTQFIMAQMYPYIVSAPPVGKNVVATCIGNELHEVGIRIVTDFLEMDGWNTYYLGANAPASAILSAIDQNKSQVLALSVTLSPHLKQARVLIEEIRAKTKWPIKIIVGGYPFLQDKELWKKIGADAHAESAETVHQKLSALFS